MCKGDPLSSREVGMADGRGLLPDFNVIGWEKSVSPPAYTPPPSLINHLNIGDDVIWVEGDLVITGCKYEKIKTNKQIVSICN